MKKHLLLAAILTTATSLSAQQAHPYKLHRYNTTDGGIIWSLSDNGRWGIVRVGSVEAGGTATPKLYDVEHEEAIELTYNNKVIAVRDVTDDGNIVVGTHGTRPVAYNRATGKITAFKMRDKWQTAELTCVTPDGKWAVGYYNSYRGSFSNAELTGDYYYSPLLVNVESGDTLALPGLPKLDMAHNDEHAMVFDAITPDGRYAIGRMDWYFMQPIASFTFIYDTQEHTYRVIGFDENDHGPWHPHVEGLHHIESTVMSPDGHYLAGLAYMSRPQEGSEFNNEYGVPFRYDIKTSELTIFDNTDSHNISVGGIDNQGTIFGNPDTGSPLRNLRVLYKDKYWISFSQICQQYYGFNWQDQTQYEYTGTVVGVSADGCTFASFPDPTGESYIFELGAPIEEVCSHIDLLSAYTTSPEAGAQFALIQNIEINFGRAVQVLGDGSNVHLYKADGTLAFNGLSNKGLTLKQGSRSTVVAAFRPRPLEDGQEYELVIDAGAIAIAGDESLTSHEIRVPYRGRNDAPVKVIKASPEDGSSLRQLDYTTSYILLNFDAPIRTTDNCEAYIERVEDGTRLTNMTVAAGTTPATAQQLLLMPAAPVYLYKNEAYRVVLEAGSVSDYSGYAGSYNEHFELHYEGTYVREVTSERILFADNFNDPNACLNTWLRYEGDHNTPTSTMQSWGFDANNNPWNYTLHDDEGDSDYFAGSHSMYSPSGASNDWMMTPQIAVPEDGKAVLEFDAQSYYTNKKDYLTLYIYESHDVLSHLTTDIMQGIYNKVELLDSVLLNSGENQEITKGEWTHYQYDLAPWAGKDIYIAFVNRNEAQSAIFVNNVLVQREILYSIAFQNRDRVVGQTEISISGTFTVKCDETEGQASMILRDADGNEVSRVEWDNIPAEDTAVEFAFDRPLPLTVGTQVPYTIDVTIGSKSDTFSGEILDLAFEPVKRVVLEEMTGITCPNCPLGIFAIEKCKQSFGDRFIPVAIHSYTGDNLGAAFGSYSAFLGLQGAPTARINRLPEVYFPMVSDNDDFVYRDDWEGPLWYDIVAQELNRLTMADLELHAELSEDNKEITFKTDLKYALTADNQQLSLFMVVLEDGIEGIQENNFASLQTETLGEWCNGGKYASHYVYPFIHDHVVRSVIGQTFSGTIGLFPTELVGGEVYSTSFKNNVPASTANVEQLSAVAMLIDTQTGEVINAAHSHVKKASESGIHSIEADAEAGQSCTLRSLSGAVIRNAATNADLQQLPAGIYLLGGRKVMVQ